MPRPRSPDIRAGVVAGVIVGAALAALAAVGLGDLITDLMRGLR